MNHFSLIIPLCILSLFCQPVIADDDDLEPTSKIVNGQVVIHLDEEAQEMSGLETQHFKIIKLQTELTTYGKAISVNPLLSTLNQYLAISTKQATAKARLASAEKSMNRLRNLHKNQAVSSTKLQQQQVQWHSDKALYEAMIYQSKYIINSSQLQWGEKLTHWSTGRHSIEFDNFLSGKATLLTVSIPTTNTLLPPLKTIFISPEGNRRTAFTASFISVLPTIDAFSQRKQYSFFTDDPRIKPGMNFTAWIPQHTEALSGIIIPEAALAWHLGQSFIFKKIDDERFIHKNISAPIKVPQGYFISEPLSDDNEIVIKGTQMLLSHEFRSQIPDEDDD